MRNVDKLTFEQEKEASAKRRAARNEDPDWDKLKQDVWDYIKATSPKRGRPKSARKAPQSK